MIRIPVRILLALTAALLLFTPNARARTVSYPVNMTTSRGNPVTDILILESDGMQVHPSIYPSTLPGTGTSVIVHDVPFVPIRSLVIGLTLGLDVDGTDKTQIMMLLDSDFAASHIGVQFSSIFPGTRHSLTIASLQAALAGDATQLAWFTDTFFPGPAAGATFATGGPFTVAEFTALSIDGVVAASGNWLLTNFTSIPRSLPNLAVAQIAETAQGDLGPFDMLVTINSNSGRFLFDKTVLNNTGVAWSRFELQLGTGTGQSFVPAVGEPDFLTDEQVSETTGAFPVLEPPSMAHTSVIVFDGFLPPGGTAHFVLTARADNPKTFTLRESAVQGGAPAPALSSGSLLMLVVLLGGVATLRLQRTTLRR